MKANCISLPIIISQSFPFKTLSTTSIPCPPPPLHSMSTTSIPCPPPPFHVHHLHSIPCPPPPFHSMSTTSIPFHVHHLHSTPFPVHHLHSTSCSPHPFHSIPCSPPPFHSIPCSLCSIPCLFDPEVFVCSWCVVRFWGVCFQGVVFFLLCSFITQVVYFYHIVQ